MSSELRDMWENAGGKAPNHWQFVKFEDLLASPKSIAVGVMYPGSHVESGVPLIKVSHVKNGAVASKPDFRISEEVNHEYRRTNLCGDELLITLVGNPGDCAIVDETMAGWNVARAIAVVRLQDPSIRYWLRYILLTDAAKHLIGARLNTTVQKTLNLKDIRSLPVPLAPQHERRAIVEVAAALEKKMIVNNQTNQTLEQIAQAIFKSWFVDFEPVKAKINALAAGGSEEDALLAAMQSISGNEKAQLTQLKTENPERYNELCTTAELFPSAMQDSELGEIPEGWQLPSFEELVKAKQGKYQSKEKMSQYPSEYATIPVWGGNGILGYTSKCTYSNPVVLMTCRGSNCGLIRYTEGASWVSNNAFACTPKIGSIWFLLTYFRLSSFEDCISGSAQPQITYSALKSKELPFPVNDKICYQFSALIESLFQNILKNRKGNYYLEETRNALLPKLLSGELKV